MRMVFSMSAHKSVQRLRCWRGHFNMRAVTDTTTADQILEDGVQAALLLAEATFFRRYPLKDTRAGSSPA
jgi:hypothetical protein